MWDWESNNFPIKYSFKKPQKLQTVAFNWSEQNNVDVLSNEFYYYVEVYIINNSLKYGSLVAANKFNKLRIGKIPSKLQQYSQMGSWNSIPKFLKESDQPFYKLKWHIRMWNKDSHGLFDFHSASHHIENFTIQGNSFVCANLTCVDNTNVELIAPDNKPADNSLTKLLSVAYK